MSGRALLATFLALALLRSSEPAAQMSSAPVIKEQSSYYYLDNQLFYEFGGSIPELLPGKMERTFSGVNNGLSSSIQYEDGWPASLGSGKIAGCGYGGTYVDLDRDGDLEIIQSSRNTYVYAWHHDGTSVAGWPFKTSSFVIAAPAVGDIDNDGYPEVVINSNNGYLYALTHNGVVMDGWPIRIDVNWTTSMEMARYQSSPVLADVNGDSCLEIIFNRMYISSTYPPEGTYIYNYEGQIIPGWPQTYLYGEWTDCTPCVADLDGDGSLEIVTGVIYSDEPPNHNKIYVWHADGSLMEGWPRIFEDYWWSPFRAITAGDVSGDGEPDIVAADMQYVYVTDKNGAMLEGWPYYIDFDLSGHYLALANFDADMNLEVVVTWPSGNQVILLDHNGTVMNGFPASVPIPYHATVADIDNDGRNEIICDSYGSNSIYAINDDGSLAAGFPLPTSGHAYYYPLIVDLDDDGDVEIGAGDVDLTGSPLYYYVWDLNSPCNYRMMAWPMFMHDRCHTGMYGYSAVTDARLESPPDIVLYQNYPNPFNPSTTFRFSIPEPMNVKLEIHNVRGELVRILWSGRHEGGTKEIRWDGEDGEGHAVASGIYFYTLSTPRISLSRKLVYLK